MAAIDDMRTELESINSSTNDLAADIDDLLARLGNSTGGLSASETAEVLDLLRAKSAALKATADKYSPPAP